MARFKVLRRHDGDKVYHEGDVREAEAVDVAHLIPLGVLKPVKADTPLKNRVEDAAEARRQASSEASSAAAADKAAADKAAADKAAADKAAADKAAADKAAADKAAG